MLPAWLLKATQGLMTSMKAAPSWAMAALMRGVSWCLSPEKLRATKVAPISMERLTVSMAASVLVAPFLALLPLSAVAENWPLVRP